METTEEMSHQITTTNPASGVVTETHLTATTPQELDAIVRAAVEASSRLGALSRSTRASFLGRVADGIERAGSELVSVAVRETALSGARLEGEVTRAANQFRLFARVVEDGAYLEATIDHPNDGAWTVDLRRMLRPIGPVAVFGASNFPFAFSVIGGDTAAALAAGCAVVVKAHGSHPLTSERSHQVLATAASESGLGSAVGIVYGQESGASLVQVPSIKAVGFTGSLAVGRVLMQLIAQREEPIPFYGELSSINPMVVTEGAAKTRARSIADGLFDSFTGSGGQLCTKPGVVFVPDNVHGNALVDRVVELANAAPAQALLKRNIAAGFQKIATDLHSDHTTLLVDGRHPHAGYLAGPTVLAIAVENMADRHFEECFGPFVVIARYRDLEQVRTALERVPGSLAAGIHAAADELDALSALTEALTLKVGRIVYDGYTTGVQVSWAQNHGGPWPATNSLHTSVGATSIRRFLRPFVWQNAPHTLLPEELRDDYTAIPRRVDGTWVPGVHPLS